MCGVQKLPLLVISDSQLILAGHVQNSSNYLIRLQRGPEMYSWESTNLYPPGVCFADIMTSFSGVVTFVLFCFVFVFMLSR